MLTALALLWLISTALAACLLVILMGLQRVYRVWWPRDVRRRATTAMYDERPLPREGERGRRAS